MSLQLIVQCESAEEVSKRVSSLSDFLDIFSIDKQHVGISVPTRVLDDIGEDLLRDAISVFPSYDL
jgi:hypothetical protein